MSKYLQQKDEIVHWVVAGVKIVCWAQTVVRVKVHFLVDTGVTEQVEQDLLRYTCWAEVFHFYRGQRSNRTSELIVWTIMKCIYTSLRHLTISVFLLPLPFCGLQFFLFYQIKQYISSSTPQSQARTNHLILKSCLTIYGFRW